VTTSDDISSSHDIPLLTSDSTDQVDMTVNQINEQTSTTTNPTITPSSTPSSTTLTPSTPHSKSPPFKNPQFVSIRNASSSKKSRGWKNLKQMLVSEKTVVGVVSYPTLDSPLSKRPSKRYSDITGLTAKYKDPTTKLLYHNSDEFSQIRILSQDVINGYLELRKGNQ